MVEPERARGPEDEKLSALARFTRGMIEAKDLVKDEEFEAMRSVGYGDSEFAEVSGVIALVIFSNYFDRLNGTDLDFPERSALDSMKTARRGGELEGRVRAQVGGMAPPT